MAVSPVAVSGLLRRMLLARRVLADVFGSRVAPLIAGGVLLPLRGVMSAALHLDRVFFPCLSATVIRSPIMIVGNPRTGTTFLQRFLCENGFGAGLQLYRMVYPSLIAQKLLAPIVSRLEAISPARFHKGSNHETGLQQVETDDVALLFRFFDGYFLYSFILAHAGEDYLPLFDGTKRDTASRDFDWLEELWKRSLVFSKQDRVVAKMFSTGARMPDFLRRFPDARILYMARDPVAVIPSAMSLVTGVLDNAFGFWSLPEDHRTHYLERLYAAFVILLRKFHDDWTGGRIDRSQVYIVRYDHMMQDFEGVMAEICAFIGHRPTPAQCAAIHSMAAMQRGYSGGGSYDLARFGLSADQIRRDTAFFVETFLPTDESPVSHRISGGCEQVER